MIQFLAVIVLLVPQTSRPKTTTLSFEIITPPGTGSRVAAQDWGRVFAKLGHTVRVRQQTSADGNGPSEAVSQTETKYSRRIKAIGLLDKQGRVHFGSKTFRSTDTRALGDWIANLKQFGVQGDPAGKPMWGLTADQFDKVFKAMAKPVSQEIKGRPFGEAITALEIPNELPIKWADGTEQIAKAAGTVDRQLQLFARGAALGIILNDAGLGFMPQRQPNGSLAILITKRGKEPLWPIGWLPKLSLNRSIPNFYQPTDVSLPGVKLMRVFSAIEAKTKVPVLVDHYQIKAKGQDFEKMRAKVNPRKMSWNAVIRTVTVSNRMNYDIRIDELGKPFVWVSTTEVIKARKNRFKPK